MAQPVIEATDITLTTADAVVANANPNIDTPAYNIGDLIIQSAMSDGSPTFTPPATGLNGETLLTSVTGGNGSPAGPVAGMIAYIATSTELASSLAWSLSVADEVQGRTVVVPSGEHDGIGAVSGFAGSSVNSATLPTPAFTAGATDGNGTVLTFLGNDNDPINTAPVGWQLYTSDSVGAVTMAVGVRDAAVVNSESIASVDYAVTADTNTSVALIVREASTGDTTPDQFTFTDQTDVALSTLTTSNTITITGIDTAANISVTGGEYSINAGAYTSVAGTVSLNDTVTVRHTSSALNSTATDTTLTVDTISDVFTSTTLAATALITITGITGGESLTGLEWVVFSSQDLSTASILAQGSGESTNVNGDLVLDVAGSGATNGQAVWYTIKDIAETNEASGPATVVVT